MVRFALKRLLLMIPVVWGVATLTFFFMKLTPGDPALAVLGEKADPAALERLRHSWGLDQPLFTQYWSFLKRLVQGDLGESFIYQVPVSDLLAVRMPATLELMAAGLILAVAISVPLSLWVASSQAPVASAVVRLFTATVQGMPTFFIGTLLISWLALGAGWFPVGGYGDDAATRLHSLVLPGLAIGLSVAPMLVRSLVSSLEVSMSAQYVEFAKSKGLSRRAVLGGYALRNASISGVSILGIQAGSLVGGTLVVENVFAIPGTGSLLMQSVLARDLAVVQALTVCFGVLVVVVYALTDLAYGWLDPRARAGKAGSNR